MLKIRKKFTYRDRDGNERTAVLSGKKLEMLELLRADPANCPSKSRRSLYVHLLLHDHGIDIHTEIVPATDGHYGVYHLVTKIGHVETRSVEPAEGADV